MNGFRNENRTTELLHFKNLTLLSLTLYKYVVLDRIWQEFIILPIKFTSKPPKLILPQCQLLFIYKDQKQGNFFHGHRKKSAFEKKFSKHTSLESTIFHHVSDTMWKKITMKYLGKRELNKISL